MSEGDLAVDVALNTGRSVPLLSNMRVSRLYLRVGGRSSGGYCLVFSAFRLPIGFFLA